MLSPASQRQLQYQDMMKMQVPEASNFINKSTNFDTMSVFSLKSGVSDRSCFFKARSDVNLKNVALLP